jgi:hypothetical protein
MAGAYLMAWEDVLEPATEDQIVEAGRKVAAAMV